MKEKDKKERIDSSNNDSKKLEGKSKKEKKKSQAEILEETLGLEPNSLAFIEKRLYITRFMDYFSEETLDFIYRDKQLEKYKTRIIEMMESIDQKDEEDKLLKQSLENKQIFKICEQLKRSGEELALEKGIKQSIDKKIRNYSLFMGLPIISVVLILSIFNLAVFAFPLLCVFCGLSSYPRIHFLKKWQIFKEENKIDFYTKNREDIMILKGFTGDSLKNIRRKLLELKIPLQLIKFVLYSSDYENLNILTSRTQKSVSQYVLSFEYPPDVEPFAIPESLAQLIPEEEKSTNKLEENFVVLKSIKTTNGIIENFIPTLKEELVIEINNLLNNCQFSKSTQDIDLILPNYSPENAIYCKCGEYVEIDNVQICNLNDDFKFYLFEGKPCNCGEKIYAISLMDQNTDVPEDLKQIFLD